MKVLTIENDIKFEDVSKKYLKNFESYTSIMDAHNVDTDIILDAFKEHEILVIKPTEITFSQYNLMLMAMYKLLASKSLGIKELHIISYDSDELEDELKSLWDGRRKYLDQVLPHIKIYSVYPNMEKKEIHI